jgi:hypothetical protein
MVTSNEVPILGPAMCTRDRSYKSFLTGVREGAEQVLSNCQHAACHICPSYEHFPLTPLFLERGLYSFLFSVHCRKEYRSTEYSAGIFKQSMGARNRLGIGLSYRPARLHRLAELILEIDSWVPQKFKIRAQGTGRRHGSTRLITRPAIIIFSRRGQENFF